MKSTTFLSLATYKVHARTIHITQESCALTAWIDLRNKVDEVWESMTEEGDKSRNLEKELREMQKAVEEEREERRRLAQAMAEERERREELERKLTRLLELQQGPSPAQG